MYDLTAYRAMIDDTIRAEAYTRALVAAVRPGARVIELGTGIGFFAIAACQAGAGSVVAIEPDDAIRVGPRLAEANGCADRIQFVQDVSFNVQVDPGDVLLSDMRGVLPHFERHIPAIVDARTRLLRQGGHQIPTRDTLWLALVESPTTFGERAPPGTAVPGHPPVDLRPLNQLLVNSFATRRVTPQELLSEPVQWFEIDYRTVTDANAAGDVTLRVTRPGRATGIALWFDTDLFAGHGFSNAPDRPEAIYGNAVFRLPTPIDVATGTVVDVRVEAVQLADDYVWRWSGVVRDGSSEGRRFAGSTFHSMPLVAHAWRRRADRYVPRLNRRGEAHAWALSRIDGSVSNAEIAREVTERFPDVCVTYGDALAFVGRLADELSS